MAVLKKYYILVRDSNEYAMNCIGKPGYLPKPEKLKAKSRKSEPDIGLVAADPNDPDVKAMLREDKIEYKDYERKLKELGMFVDQKPPYLILKQVKEKGKTFNMKFFSDYDLTASTL